MRSTNTKILSSILLAFLFLGVFPISALAAPQQAVVIGNSYTLATGQTLGENLFIAGGNVNLMAGSTVNGDVVILGGTAQAAGTINGNLTVVGGTLNLAATFLLNGNLATAGTAFNRDPGARITGQVNINSTGSKIIIPGQVQIPYINTNTNLFFKVISYFVRLVLWVLAAMLLAMIIPNHLARTSQAAFTQPLISGGLGLLTVIVVPILAVLAAITICLIPVAVLGILLLIIAWCFGLITLGYEIGKRLSSTSATAWHPALTAGLGTLLLIGVLNGVDALVPCVGWIPKVLVGIIGLGAVLLTQFGMKTYIPTPGSPVASPPANLPPG